MTSSTPGSGWTLSPVFQLGKNKTLAIPMSLHEAARRKVVDILKARGVTNGVILLKGGDEQNQYDTDTELVFRQDSWFNYLFGVKEPGVYGAISLSNYKSTLFIPKLPEEYRMWCGTIYPPSHFRLSYAVNDVLYTDEIQSWMTQELSSEGSGAQIHVMSGTNTDSGLSCVPAHYSGMETLPENTVNMSLLHHALSTARVTKSPYEVEVMRYCAYVASNAHVEVMRTTKAGMIEFELEAKFQYEIYKNGGCRRCAYTSICACGPNGAVLHYGHAGAPNDRSLLQTDMALLDMGAEYHGYVSDITCSFPVSGSFSEDQRVIYEGVLNAQRVVVSMMKPGTAWPDCHRAAELEILKALIKAGVLYSDGSSQNLEEIVNSGVGAIFFPHGLGHLIGCDTHDVGGYIEGTPGRPERDGLKKLRTARVLEAGMVLTNEPGCYFIDYLMNKAVNDPVMSKHINVDAMNRFRFFGGVRLEDVVLVTEEGADNLTTCPRTVAEVESVLNGGVWPPVKDDAPELRRRWTALNAEGKGMTFLNIQ